MNFDNYDEFGNYIGPEIPGINNDEDEDEENNLENSIEEENDNEINTNKKNSKIEIDESKMNNSKDNISQSNDSNSEYKIILHEDKIFYPESNEIFPNAENIVMEEDAQPITQPIIAPIQTKKFDIYEKEIPELNFSIDYLNNLINNPKLIRNISIAGGLHHGTSSTIFKRSRDILFGNSRRRPAKS